MLAARERQSMPQPLVSVILPVYNGAPDVVEAINSVLRQTLGDFELIVVDDGSSDGTPELLRSVADSRVRIFHQEHTGVVGALNLGLDNARGLYIARMDHDDRARPTRFEKQLRFLDANPDCGMVGTRAEIWVGDRPSGRAHDHPTDDAGIRFELLFNNYIVHSSVMVRKSAFDAVGKYVGAPQRPGPEDYEYWSRFSRRYRMANLPEYLSVCREIPHSISRMGVRPFDEGVLLFSSENLAAAVGETSVRSVHRDTAALINVIYHEVSAKPDLTAMCDLIAGAGDRIAAQAPGCDVPARVKSRIANLRFHYFAAAEAGHVAATMARRAGFLLASFPSLKRGLQMRPLIVPIENALRRIRKRPRSGKSRH
jgi:glycosyltransferase involved in cell wall biosynthesis